MIRSVIVLALVLSASAAEARGERPALVEGVETFGGLSPEGARAHLDHLLAAAGYRIVDGGVSGCSGDRDCIGRHVRAAGADVAVRATYLEVGGAISAAFVLVGSDGRGWEISSREVSLDTISDDLARSLSAPEKAVQRDQPRSSARRRSAWALAGTGVVLAVGGGLMMWEARSQRDEFFDRFVDDQGNIVGLSPIQARARQDRANRWLVAGAAATGLGLLAGAGSIWLFATTTEPGSTGIVVRGQF